MARYLRMYPQSSLMYAWQEQPAKLAVFSDADWGGCARTRRSTSGGLVLHGSHLLSCWSRTQQCVAPSSCESEVSALVKAGVEGLGANNKLRQCGEDVALESQTDASAAAGLCSRQGAGKVKHLTVRQLWAQEKEAAGELKIRKVPRSDNAADMFTHHWSTAEGNKFLRHISIRRTAADEQPSPRRRVGVCLHGTSV